MFIISQDRDTIFTLSDKGLLKGQVYAEDQIINGKFYGRNIYGQNILRKRLLGTYEEEEAEQVVSEIYKFLKMGIQYYSMPAPALDLEDLEVDLDG